MRSPVRRRASSELPAPAGLPKYIALFFNRGVLADKRLETAERGVRKTVAAAH